MVQELEPEKGNEDEVRRVWTRERERERIFPPHPLFIIASLVLVQSTRQINQNTTTDSLVSLGFPLFLLMLWIDEGKEQYTDVRVAEVLSKIRPSPI